MTEEEEKIGTRGSAGSVSTRRETRSKKKTYETALMSLSCPVNVCTALPVRMSHTLAVVSHAPETKTFWFGPRERLRSIVVPRQKPSTEEEEKGEKGNAPHDVSRVVVELNNPHSRIHIPKHAAHVTRRRQDLTVVQEATAREVPRVSRQLPRDLDGPLLAPQVVNRANVVESTASDKVTARGIGARHDPRRPEGDGVDLVGRVGVPDDELAVLRGGHEVTLVLGPVHGVDFGEVTLEGSSRSHGYPREGVDFGRHGTDWGETRKEREDARKGEKHAGQEGSVVEGR